MESCGHRGLFGQGLVRQAVLQKFQQIAVEKLRDNNKANCIKLTSLLLPHPLAVSNSSGGRSSQADRTGWRSAALSQRLWQ